MSDATREANDGAPVTVTIARRVVPGQEIEFETWAERLTVAASRFAGFLGAGLLRPGHVGQDWHVVYRFDSADHLAAWERSPVRKKVLSEAEHLMETTAIRRVTGLETWFALPGRSAPAPPRWKMFVVTVLAIYGLQLLVNVCLDRLTASWPSPLRLGMVGGIVTASMTWIVMPRLARLLEPWLYGPPR